MTGRTFPELMTPAQAAAALGVDVKTLTRWAKAGRLRCFQTLAITGTGHRRFYRAEIDALIAGKPLTSEQLDALVRGEEW